MLAKERLDWKASSATHANGILDQKNRVGEEFGHLLGARRHRIDAVLREENGVARLGVLFEAYSSQSLPIKHRFENSRTFELLVGNWLVRQLPTIRGNNLGPDISKIGADSLQLVDVLLVLIQCRDVVVSVLVGASDK